MQASLSRQKFAAPTTFVGAVIMVEDCLN